MIELNIPKQTSITERILIHILIFHFRLKGSFQDKAVSRESIVNF